MNQCKILIIDDNPYELKSFEYFFSKYNLTTCIDPEIALNNSIKNESFHIIITDIFMEKINGLELLQMIKSSPKNKDSYIMACTGISLDKFNSVMSEIGFDEIIEKPVKMDILDLKIRTIMKKVYGISTFKEESLIEDKNNFTFYLKGIPIHLTYKEYEILKLLVDNYGKVVTHEEVYQALYGKVERSSNIIKSHVKNLRNKISKIDPSKDYIKTIHLKGYKLTY